MFEFRSIQPFAIKLYEMLLRVLFLKRMETYGIMN